MRQLHEKLLIGVSLIAAAACGGGGEATPPPEYPAVEDTTTTTVTAVPEQPAEPAEPAEPPPPPIQISAGERTPIEGQAPALRITAPRNGQKIRSGNVNLRAQLRNWKLEEDPGKHVHLIIDDKPYIAIRDLSKPLNLNALMKEHHNEELSAGTHVVRMFPSRAHHESVKENTPFAMVVFHYQEETEGFELDKDAPLLTYSRPKGCVEAGKKTLLDFYLTNVEELAEDGTRVRVNIDGDFQQEIAQWVPHYIENLSVGSHQITLTLIDGDGQPIAGPYNRTTRTVHVREVCEPPAPAPAESAEEEAGEAGPAAPAPAGATNRGARPPAGQPAAATPKKAGTAEAQ